MWPQPSRLSNRTRGFGCPGRAVADDILALFASGRDAARYVRMVSNVPPRLRNRHANDALHPAIYRVIIGVTIFWVVAAGGFLGAGTYSNVLLGVVGVFAFMTLAIPLTLRRIVHHHGFGRRRAEPVGGWERLHDWLGQRLDVWGDEMSGRDAAIMVLSLPAAVCLQAIAFVIIYHVVGAG